MIASIRPQKAVPGGCSGTGKKEIPTSQKSPVSPGPDRQPAIKAQCGGSKSLLFLDVEWLPERSRAGPLEAGHSVSEVLGPLRAFWGQPSLSGGPIRTTVPTPRPTTNGPPRRDCCVTTGVAPIFAT
jgi:hypothetical protein